MQMMITIGGNVAGSLNQSFRRATGNIDDLRARSREAQRELNRLEREFRQGRITQEQYAAATGRITREMRQLENAQNRIKAISGTLKNGFNTAKAVAGMAALTTATAVAATAMSSINTAADFEKQMASVGAKAESTGAEMTAMKQKALELGADTSLSASEVAVAMDDLAAGGFNATKIIAAMPGIISGAEASGEDLALVAGTVTTALSVWGMEAEKASKVSDVLAMAANISAAGVEDLAYAFKYAGPPASALGITLEEVAAATAIMTDSGLDGSSAGTSLRASLLKLNNPAKAQQKIMTSLGFSMQDAKGEAKSLSTIVKDLEESTKNLTDAEKVATISKIVGTEAVSGFLSLMKAGPNQIDEMTRALENSDGASAKAAKAMMDNYAGAKEQMMGAFESAKIAFGTPILPVLQQAFSGVSDFVEGNMSPIEMMGQRAADGLKAILEPFALNKPELTTAISMDPDALANYEKELAKFNEYGEMDFSDKIIASLDTVTTAAEDWLGGSGGEAIGRVFTELGEIAVTAWLGALKGAAGATVDNVMEGNFAGAAATGGAAWLLGGGLMVKGAIGAGKWGKDIYDSRRATSTPPTPSTVPPTTTGGTRATSVPNRAPVATISPVSTTRPVYGQNATRILSGAPSNIPPTAVASNTAASASRGSRLLGGASKVMGKAMLPLAVAGEVINIARSEDKVKATAEAGSGLAGGLGGAKLGAAIGTAIAPGIGTAIGAAIFGIGGYIGGKFLGGKATDAVRGSDKATAQAPTATAQPTSVTNEGFNTSMTASTTAFTQLATSTTTMGTTMVTSMTALDTQTKLVTHNMGTLVQWTGQASGWIATLNGIQPAGQRVIDALNNLEQRINAINLPGTSGGGRTAYE